MKAALAVILLAACIVRVTEPGYAVGGQPAFHAGSPEAYWIWHDAGGWHLRTTTMAARHRFHGAVYPAAGGVLSDVRPVGLEWGDRIRMGARGIEFDFETHGFEDGFDWRVSSGCNQFDIFIDGKPHPHKVHLGAGAMHPRGIPFESCR